MGEAANDIINGICCQICGQWMPDCFIKQDDGEFLNNDLFDNPPGYPRTCPDCQAEDDLRNEEY